jgi:hypothetical protein
MVSIIRKDSTCKMRDGEDLSTRSLSVASKWLTPVEEKRFPGPSWREKFSMLKDISFRSAKNGSGRKIEEESTTQLDFSADDLLEPRNVRFALECNQVRKIEAWSAPHCELWWTAEELALSRCEGKFAAATDADVQAYIQAFDRAYNQVRGDRKLKAGNLKELVQGLSQGHRGLEQHSSSYRRKTIIREHVLSVLNCCHDRNNIYNNSFNDSKRSLCSIGSTDAPCCDDRAIRNHSAKLSAGNRHFAAAMGKAERMAIYKEGALATSEFQRRRESV